MWGKKCWSTRARTCDKPVQKAIESAGNLALEPFKLEAKFLPITTRNGATDVSINFPVDIQITTVDRVGRRR